MEHDQIQFDLFKTPFYDRLVRLGLTKSVGLVILITWIPLVALSTCHRSVDFLTDVSVYLKFLVALPLMLIAPFSVKKKLKNIILHFIKSGIIKEAERETYLSYVSSTQYLKKSLVIKILLWILIYFIFFYFQRQNASYLSSTWRMNGDERLSYAGIWFAFISHPIFNFLQFYFIFNAILWFRLMYKISQLDLQLNASHGDDTAGLIFLGGSIRTFYLPIFAFSSTFATGAIQQILYHQFEINDLRFALVILVLFCLFLFIGPLMFFYFPLMKVKNQSVFRYGILGRHQLQEFEMKWLDRKKDSYDSSLIDSPDFSSVIDNISIVNKVYLMRLVPFTHRVFFGFIICILLPFLPAFALEISWTKLFEQLMRFVM